MSAIECGDAEEIVVAVLVIDRSVEKEVQRESKRHEQMQMLRESGRGRAQHKQSPNRDNWCSLSA